MKPSLRLQLQRLAMRLAELDAHLADPALGQDMARYRAVAREHAEAAAVVARLRAYEQRAQVAQTVTRLFLRQTARNPAADER